MSFREKTAWIALAAILIAASVYFGTLVAHYRDPSHAFAIGLFLKVVVLQTVITAGATIVAAIASPADARAPRDERDHMVAALAAGRAYYPLLVGVAVTSASINFGATAFDLLNGMLAMIMLAEAWRFAAQIVLYRRGA
ncbi:hypothetical protein [Sphingomonas bacterium]|uniref:hypothetical protein n=1 Tax=Sphingomonas bacterium TaxID=1895847 RepID=UPI0026314482|nr:hypothetical protein [Sphingomonas bacterium]MDB5679976.1 hypothetical protein [Sphingomonas bacterium]